MTERTRKDRIMPQGAWVVRFVGVIGLYLMVWALFNPQTQKETVIALLVWFGPMAFWWVKSETVYEWLKSKRERK
jgi:hypothetical protein